MEYDQVKDLINTITNTDIKVFELKFENAEIKIDRNIRSAEPTVVAANVERFETAYTQQGEVVQQQVYNEQSAFIETTANVASEVVGDKVVSPIVGTFYDKSSPDAEPFVKVGSKVKKGDVLFIIEAMKVINEITSEFEGEVKEILVKDGQMVEYDQTLMIIG